MIVARHLEYVVQRSLGNKRIKPLPSLLAGELIAGRRPDLTPVGEDEWKTITKQFGSEPVNAKKLERNRFSW